MDDVMFVDVSQNNALINDGPGNHVIADRSKLDTLFQLLHTNDNPKRIIVCDLSFDTTTPQDSSLQASMAGFPNLLSAVKSDWYEQITPNVIRAGACGTTGFHNLKEPILIFSNSLLKFSLTDKNCIKTLPLLMFERVNHKTTSCLGDALHIGDDWYTNTVLINKKLEQDVAKAVFEDQVIPIGKLLKAVEGGQKEFVRDLRHKKFIVIGNFEEDIHKTMFGDMPGPILLFDIFLSLQQGENMISTWWIIVAVIFFTLITYKKFYHVILFKNYSKWLDEKMRFLGFKRPLEFNWLIIYLFIIFSSVVFHIYIEFVAVIFFFNVLAFARIYIKTRRIKWLQFQKSGRKLNVVNALSFLFKKPGFKN